MRIRVEGTNIISFAAAAAEKKDIPKKANFVSKKTFRHRREKKPIGNETDKIEQEKTKKTIFTQKQKTPFKSTPSFFLKASQREVRHDMPQFFVTLLSLFSQYQLISSLRFFDFGPRRQRCDNFWSKYQCRLDMM